MNQINLHWMRVFAAVYGARSMTAAAKDLRLTQSGVSQHMASLEDTLGVKLFQRIGRRLVPTSEAEDLYRVAVDALGAIDRVCERLGRSESKLRGSVRIGMPIEFGNNVVIPILAGLAREHPDLGFKLSYGFATEMNQLLLSGELDFAFVDAFSLDPRIEIKKVFDETLWLCATEGLLASAAKPFRRPWRDIQKNPEFLAALPIVDYQPSAPLFKLWFEFHLGRELQKKWRREPRVSLMDVQGVARLIAAGVGAGILPGHLMAGESQKKIRTLGDPRNPLHNPIQLAWVRERIPGVAASAVRAELERALKSAGTGAAGRHSRWAKP